MGASSTTDSNIPRAAHRVWAAFLRRLRRKQHILEFHVLAIEFRRLGRPKLPAHRHEFIGHRSAFGKGRRADGDESLSRGCILRQNQVRPAQGVAKEPAPLLPSGSKS